MNQKELLEKAISMYTVANNITAEIKPRNWIDHALGKTNDDDVSRYIQMQKALTKGLIDCIIGRDSELIVGQTAFNINKNEIYKKLEKSVN